MDLLHNLLAQWQYIFAASKANLPLVLSLMAVLWVVHIANFMMAKRLNTLGILPRKMRGLVGIILAPMLHSDWEHLFVNTIPMTFLLTFVLISNRQHFWPILGFIWLASGLLIWLFGRKGIHIGASALALGLWGFVVMNAYYHFSLLTVLLALMCLLYFGTLWLNILPLKKESSWEGHLFGLIAGIGASLLL